MNTAFKVMVRTDATLGEYGFEVDVVDDNVNVKGLKELINARVGMEVSQQLLVVAVVGDHEDVVEIELEDDRLLADYDITKSTTQLSSSTKHPPIVIQLKTKPITKPKPLPPPLPPPRSLTQSGKSAPLLTTKACKTCKRSVGGDSQQPFYLIRDEAYHVGCMVCTRCEKLIDKTQQPVGVGEGLYHPDCLLCYQCNKPIHEGNCLEKGGRLLCKSCFIVATTPPNVIAEQSPTTTRRIHKAAAPSSTTGQQRLYRGTCLNIVPPILSNAHLFLKQRLSSSTSTSTEVWKARNDVTDEAFAIKFFHSAKRRDEEAQRLKEIAQHPQITPIDHKDSASGRLYFGVMMEYGESLFDILMKPDVEWDHKRKLLNKAALAVSTLLHSKGLVWTDLKPQHFIVTGPSHAVGVIKIIDLEHCVKEGERATLLTDTLQRMYTAPEIKQGLPVTIKTDIWSFGVMVYQVLYGKHPLVDDDGETAVIDDPEVVMERKEREFFTRCLVADPNKRSTLSELADNSLVSGKMMHTTTILELLMTNRATSPATSTTCLTTTTTSPQQVSTHIFHEWLSRLRPLPSHRTCLQMINDHAARLKLLIPALPEILRYVSEKVRDDVLTRKQVIELQKQRHITNEEVFAMALYTMDTILVSTKCGENQHFHRQLNLALQSKLKAQLEPFREYLGLLMSGLRKLPEFTGTVYRGAKREITMAGKYNQSMLVEWCGLTSTTTDKYNAVRYCGGQGADGLLFEVEIKHGIVIEPFSVLEHEREVVLSPTTQLIVTKPLHTDSLPYAPSAEDAPLSSSTGQLPLFKGLFKKKEVVATPATGDFNVISLEEVAGSFSF